MTCVALFFISRYNDITIIDIQYRLYNALNTLTIQLLHYKEPKYIDVQQIKQVRSMNNIIIIIIYYF